MNYTLLFCLLAVAVCLVGWRIKSEDFKRIALGIDLLLIWLACIAGFVAR